jgi:transcriptional antiterminator
MAEENNSIDNRSTSPLPFEDFVRQQFELVFARLDSLESSLRTEIAERLLQLSRQIKHLDQKVDIFIQEQIYMKDELRELREIVKPKN